MDSASDLAANLFGWIVLLTPFAIAGGVLLGGLAVLVTLGIEDPRRTRLVRLAWFFPAACFVWLIAVSEAQNLIDESVFHRAAGEAPLVGGYVLRESYEGYGTVSRPDRPVSPADDDDALQNVTALAVCGPYIAGTYPHFGSEGDSAYYFVLDTRSGALASFARQADFAAAASARHIAPAPEPISDAFTHYRALIDVVALVASWLFPVLGLVLGLMAAVTLRRPARRTKVPRNQALR